MVKVNFTKLPGVAEAEVSTDPALNEEQLGLGLGEEGESYYFATFDAFSSFLEGFAARGESS